MNERRQSRLVSEDDTTVVLDDVRWGWEDQGEPRLVPTFQQVAFQPERVLEIYWWSENFRPEWIAAHGQLAFVMDGTDAVRAADGAKDIGFIYTVEPFFKDDEKFEVLEGFKRSYPLVHLVTSLRDRVQRASVIYKQSIDAFRLLLTPEQKRQLARAALLSAATLRPDERYHTTRKSCVTEAIRLVNRVLPEAERVPRWSVPGLVANPRLAFPQQTPAYLVERGLAEPAESWDGSVRVLKFPQADGGVYELDVLGLPGSKVPPGVRGLEDALFDYTNCARELRETRANAARVKPADPGHQDQQHALAAAEAGLHQALARVEELTLATPSETVPYLLGLVRPKTPQADLLVRSLVRSLTDARTRGEWSPIPAHAAALEALAEDTAEPSPRELPLEERPFVPRQRLLEIVSETPEEIVVENLRWGFADVGEPRLVPTFQQTTIRPRQVADVYYWSESFPPKWLAAHGQFAFVMEGEGGATGADGREALGLIYSVEAHYRVGQSYSPIKGLHPHSEYGVIHIMTTLTDRLQQAHVLYGHSMDTYRLKLSQTQKQQLLREALTASALARPDERYHTTRHSCVTGALQTLNKVLPGDEEIRMWTVPGLLHNLKVSHPKWTPPMLIDKGLAEHHASWDEKVCEVRLPQQSGPDRVIDVLALTGSKVPRELRNLERAIQRYVELAQSYRSLARLQRLSPSRDDAFFHAQRELGATQAALGETLEEVVALATNHPQLTAPYLLSQEVPQTAQADALVAALLPCFEELAGKTWEPSAEEVAAMEELGRRG